MTDWEWRQEFFWFFLIMILILFALLNLAGLCLYVSIIYYIDAKKAMQARTLISIKNVSTYSLVNLTNIGGCWYFW